VALRGVFAQGRVCAFLGTPLGDETACPDAFWKTEAWPAWLAQMVRE
jgi:hypothetical protein